MTGLGKPATYEYLVSGRPAGGRRRRTEIVEAATGDEAVNHFTARGYSEIVLHTDDVTAPLYKPKLHKNHSPARMVWLRTAGVPELAVYVATGAYRAYWFALVPALVIVAGTRALGLPWGFVDAVAALILVGHLGFTLYFVLVRLFGLNQRINRALAWARWEEVLRLMDRVAGRGPAFECHVVRAQALAGMGRLADALREFDQVTDLPGIPESLYWAHQALVYQAAGQPEKMVQVQERAHEVAPTASGVTIIYAHNLAIVRGDLDGARRLLAGLRGHAVSDLVAPFLHSLEGTLALKEGRPEEAVAHLTRGYTLLRRFARGSIANLPQAARIRARLALALAAAGDTAAARRHFLRARPVLVAHREDDFIRQCEQAVG